MRMTQSLLGAIDKCYLAAQFQLDRPEWAVRVGSASRAVGTGFHAGVEIHYRERMVTPEVLPDLEQMIGVGCEVFDLSMELDLYDNLPLDQFIFDDKIPDAATAHELIAAMLIEYVEGGHFWPVDWLVLDVEANYTLETEHGPMKLGADLVLQDPNDWIVLVDHKTSGKAWNANKHHPRKNDQASLYTHLARQMWPDAPGHRFVFDILIFPNSKHGVLFDRRISDPQPIHEAAVMKKADDFMNLYELVHVRAGRDLPANPASSLCNPKWCDWFEGCPHGRALDT